ncbi:MAG TPA: aminotransferase class IV [Actinomycetes bacterium]|nr:aminotransferase class IV [Actinomycetes bacterium]
MKVWVNGVVVDERDAYVSVFDHGFTVGDGVFETLRTTPDGRPFALTRHLQRLTRSAAGLGLEPPEDKELRAAVEAVLAANAGEPVGRVRITVSGGLAPLGSGRGAAPPTVVVMAGPASVWPPTTVLLTSPWPRNERSAVAGLKTTSYAENVVALAWAQHRGATEALLLNTEGYVCEGTGSNVFAVLDDGRIVTPPLTAGCLAGVTRDLVLQWCGGEEMDLLPGDLASAAEVFVTSSTRDVHPVDRLDERRFAAPGPLTSRVGAEFARRAAEDPDPL